MDDMEFMMRSKALDVAVAVTARASNQGQAVTITEAAQEAYNFLTAGSLGPASEPTTPDTLPGLEY